MFIFLTLSILALPCTADERILLFHSDIAVNADSSMLVSETISVRSAHQQIKRGIYREFPTTYRDLYGNRHTVGFQVVRVLRDGKPEPYHCESCPNGVRVYIGRRDVFLPPGEYTYTLAYTTDRQLGYFSDHDELYWNVTGNGWMFPIAKASATIVFPDGFPKNCFTLDGYTGPAGSRAKDFISSVDPSGVVNFATTTPLGPNEGLTIVVGWPKGLIAAPTPLKEAGYFIRDNRSALVVFAGLVILLGFYMAAWVAVGKDPAKGTIIPLYEPPRGFSPAQIRCIVRMGYDNKAFSAAVINMAVKGFLKITEEDGIYTLSTTRTDTSGLAQEEERIAAAILSSGPALTLQQDNHETISRAIDGVRRDLKKQCERTYFVTNIGYFIAGVVISALVLVMGGFAAERPGAVGATLFIGIWLTGWTFGVFFLLRRAAAAWRAVRWGGGGAFSRCAQAIFTTLLAIFFLAGEAVGLFFLCSQTSPLMGVAVVALGGVNHLFYRLLKAPTFAGRRILDQIEGFKMFLSVAEKDRLNLLNPADRTPALFEKYLPYALALDVEQAWAEQFSDVLARAAAAGARYAPVWYSGSAWDMHHPDLFTLSLSGSLMGAISSSSTAPGSSSGFGGGGGSGGGGGGGGGGGW
jgi:uncharacterized membrane protein YgcG